MKKIIGLMMLLVVILAACNNETNDEEVQEITKTPVEVQEVTKTDFTNQRTFIGRTMPSDQMPVISQFPGEVDKLLVERGEQVEEGDVLAEILTPQYGRVELEAPISGQVQQLNMVEGRPITNQNPAAVLIDVTPLKLSIQVPANVLSDFQVNQTLKYSVSQQNHTGEATVTYIADSAEKNGLFTVEAEIDNEEQSILAGVTAQVSLEKIVAEDALTIPTEAVVERDGERVVFKAQDGKAVEVPVKVIAMQSKQTAVQSLEEDALKEGDQVVIRGQLTITDEQLIQIVEEGE